MNLDDLKSNIIKFVELKDRESLINTLFEDKSTSILQELLTEYKIMEAKFDYDSIVFYSMGFNKVLFNLYKGKERFYQLLYKKHPEIAEFANFVNLHFFAKIKGCCEETNLKNVKKDIDLITNIIKPETKTNLEQIYNILFRYWIHKKYEPNDGYLKYLHNEISDPVKLDEHLSLYKKYLLNSIYIFSDYVVEKGENDLSFHNSNYVLTLKNKTRYTNNYSPKYNVNIFENVDGQLKNIYWYSKINHELRMSIDDKYAELFDFMFGVLGELF